MEDLYRAGYAGLYTRINQIQPHPEALEKDLIKKSCIEEKNKNEFFVSPGEVSRHCYFIINGFVRTYHDHGRKEATTWFLHNNDFMIQHRGFFLGEKSHEYLQATEHTTCIKMHIDDMTWLFKKYPMFKDTYMMLTQLYFIQANDRLGWQTYSAKEKYQMLLKEYPYIIQKALSAHIASYFGISDAHYSKIKNNRL